MVTDSYYQNEQKTECVTLAQAKKHLKISASNILEDDLIQGYIAAATVDRQNYINRSIDTREYVMEVSQFETVCFTANYDNDAVAKIEYYAPGETALTTLDADSYKLRPGDIVGTKKITFTNPPATEKRNDAVKITIKQGIFLLISDMYERREDRGDIGYNSAADSKCRPYRKY